MHTVYTHQYRQQSRIKRIVSTMITLPATENPTIHSTYITPDK